MKSLERIVILQLPTKPRNFVLTLWFPPSRHAHESLKITKKGIQLNGKKDGSKLLWIYRCQAGNIAKKNLDMECIEAN